jgi:cyclopropane-fatty-acyl-phospholipid synthase
VPVTVRAGRESDLPLPSQGRWPGLDVVPRARMRAAMARMVFRRAVRGLDLRVLLPNGRVLGRGGPEAPVMRIVREREFFRRLGTGGNIGFGEAYMVGAWTADDLARVLTAFAARLTRLVPRPLQWLRRWYDARKPTAEDADRAGARENISRHYDLSNELFALFLDDTMTYSSALFADGDTLTDAQRRKIDSILDLARVGDGSSVVEIGTGWGGLAIRAAERGARVTSLTISTEQRRLAEERIAEAGVAERVRVQLQDYRDAHGRYDAVVSVEMIEAVGDRYWPAFFRTLDRLLAPGGRVALQAITMAHDRMLATRRAYTWMHKYIFPGGTLPSLRAIEDTVREHTSLRVVSRRELGQHYAETLRQWRERFLSRWEDARRLGFDGVFRRMWEYYLAYCEAGFRVGYLNVNQLALAREQGRRGHADA